MRRDDPLFRVASKLYRHLACNKPAADDTFIKNMSDFLACQAALGGLLRRIDIARRRGWQLTVERLKDDLPSFIRPVTSSCEELLSAAIPREVPVIPLQNLIDDLQQLGDEFEDIDLSQRGRIIVTSESVELEEISLGRFAIELHFDRLKERQDSSCFDCIALDPNPASSNEEVTHPHVQSKGLCAGEATNPIASALRQGRICDAFCLIHSVLQTYNSNSPYVSLDNWHGISCSDCGYSTDSDSLNYCDSCGSDVCDECICSCDVCGTSRCNGCLDTDAVSEQRCCRNCWNHCTTCKRIVDTENVDSDSGLCPACLEQKQAAENPSDTEDDNSNQENDHEHDLVPTVHSNTIPTDIPAGNPTTLTTIRRATGRTTSPRAATSAAAATVGPQTPSAA